VGGLLRAGSLLLPLAATPLLLHGLASGRLDLGGGEKDLVWLLPWALWSAAFAASGFVLWRRGWPFARSLARSLLVGVAALLVATLVLAAFGQLGVGGRF